MQSSFLIKKRLRLLRLAIDGEKFIGQHLESLRRNGHYVFHDIVSDGFNIDHVIVGPKGIYAVETKTISKPAKGKTEIYYDGEKIKINGFEPDRDPIVQAKAQAKWLQEFLKDSIGISFKVRPVVLYPGWFIKQPREVEVWVLNYKSFSSFWGYEKQNLNEEDVHLIKNRINMYVQELKKSKDYTEESMKKMSGLRFQAIYSKQEVQ